MYLTNLASAQLPLWHTMEKYSVDPDPIFRRVQLDPARLKEIGARNPIPKIKNLWQEATREIGDPCFGLKVADNWHPSNFGTLGYAMLVSKSLRITLERMIRFHKVISDIRFGELVEDRKGGVLSLLITTRQGPTLLPAWEDAGLACIMKILRINFQRELTPVRVDITHSQPDCADRYYEFFQTLVRFDAEHAALHLPLEVVDTPLPGHNAELAECSDQMMTDYLESLGSADLFTRVKRSIVGNLPSGTATVDKVASDLFFSTRTLQRMLQQENTTFLKVLNETRHELAVTYVRDKKMDLTEVAFLLGFAELSTFSRSFKRWTGSSPARFRKAA